MMALLCSNPQRPLTSLRLATTCSASNSELPTNLQISRRKAFFYLSGSLLTSILKFNLNPLTVTSLQSASARELDEQEEARIVNLFEETSQSVVFIKVLEATNNSSSSKDKLLSDESIAKVQGTGSGFMWDTFGHIVGAFVSSLIIVLPCFVSSEVFRFLKLL